MTELIRKNAYRLRPRRHYGRTLDAQLDQFRAAGCSKIYRVKVNGARPDRRGLLPMLERLEPGYAVTVT